MTDTQTADQSADEQKDQSSTQATDQTSNDTSRGKEGDRSDDQQNEFKAITSQEDLDRILTNRLKRERTKLTREIRDELAEEAELAKKPEQEQIAANLKAATERADGLEAKLRDANARSAVTDAATKANAISVRAVMALIKSDLEFDDDGEPTNVDELIAKAKKDEPSLFKAASGKTDASATSTSTKSDVAPGLARIKQGYDRESKTAT